MPTSSAAWLRETPQVIYDIVDDFGGSLFYSHCDAFYKQFQYNPARVYLCTSYRAPAVGNSCGIQSYSQVIEYLAELAASSKSAIVSNIIHILVM